jgi:ribosomal protein S18 acetylase RimI-like enzyme
MILPHHFGNEQADAAVSMLLRSVFVGEGYTPSTAQDMFNVSRLKLRGQCFSAREGDTLLGTVFLVRYGSPDVQVARETEAEIHLLAVAPTSRRHNLGERLMRAVLQAAREQGLQKIVLSTQPSMASAHALYRKLDFQRNEARDWMRGTRSYWVFELRL